MSRKLKNILMIIGLILMIGVNVLTINYVNNDIYSRTYPQNEIDNTMFGENNPNGMDEPPVKPEGDMGVNPPGGEGAIPPEQNGEMVPDSNRGVIPGQGGEMMPNQNGDMFQQDVGLFQYEIDTNASFLHYLLFIIEGIIIGCIVIYLIMSRFNKKDFKQTFKNSDKVVIFCLAVILITSGTTMVSVNTAEKYELPWLYYEEDLVEVEETKAEDIDKGEVVIKNKVNLDDYSSNITINKAGEYTLSGSLDYSVLVDADGEVILNLDGVDINSNITAAIANISKNKLIINLKDDSSNKLTDSGYSEYDGCIYSEGPLVIKGNGRLDIYGRQTDGEGIATTDNDIDIDGGNIYIESNDDGINAGGDNGGTITLNDGVVFIKASGDGIDSNKDIVVNGGVVYSMGSSRGGDAGMDADKGFELNGGEIIVLGSDMLETPLTTSKQYSINFNLTSAISEGKLVTLTNDENEVIVSFEAKEDFKTLIISSSKLIDDTYYLYVGFENTGKLENGIYYDGVFTPGDKVTVGSKDSFDVISVVTKIN